MSLVNNMLQDLEERQSPGARQSAVASPGLSQRERRSTGAKIAMASGIGLSLAAAGLWSWHSGLWNDTTPTAPPITKQIVEPAATAVTMAQAPFSRTTDHSPQSESVKQPEPVQQPVAPAAKPDDTILVIAKLLELAQQALAENRLTTPAGNNAYSHYHSILALHPNHPQAQQGLEQVCARYATLAEEALDAAEYPLAKRRIRRGLRVDPEHRLLLALQQQAAGATAPSPSVEPKPQPSMPTGIDTRIDRIALSADTLDRQAADKAKLLLADGSSARAEALLSAHLAKNPSARHSAWTLAELYLDSGQNQALQQLLTDNTALDGYQVVQLQARQKVGHNDLPGALKLLEQSPPTIDASPDYHALLAGLYHKLGQHREAATVYDKLVAINPDAHLHWLGLAVALDALQDHRAALRAFRKARQGVGEHSDVGNYIDQRIAALSNRAPS